MYYLISCLFGTYFYLLEVTGAIKSYEAYAYILFWAFIMGINKLLEKELYTASKVKHHLNSFQEKTLKLSKHKCILATCLKRDKVVTI